ncbi:hypothetical protein CYMTET_22264 [Cymbomonas tetramitiformis]|uniref:Uncharacterized protein n=1 Tax=Cymbomonas tetramitiformis TaxID=36881 RepID=A0AAE0G0X0_9CHLO|nr:hypothetical protein CYMTET_22264 [Cymbomonas tetramitiformis]
MRTTTSRKAAREKYEMAKDVVGNIYAKVYQAAADSDKDAFAAAVEQHGAPVVVRARAASGGVDISAYGFAVVESDESEDDEIDVHEELRQLRSQIGKAVTFGRASVPSASSLSFAGVSAPVSTPTGRPLLREPAHSGACRVASGAVPTARVVVPFVGPWWFAPGGPPSGAPPSPDYYGPGESEEQPTLNGVHYPVQALIYDNASFYGIEPNSEGSNTDSGYGSGMDEVY